MPCLHVCVTIWNVCDLPHATSAGSSESTLAPRLFALWPDPQTTCQVWAEKKKKKKKKRGRHREQRDSLSHTVHPVSWLGRQPRSPGTHVHPQLGHISPPAFLHRRLAPAVTFTLSSLGWVPAPSPCWFLSSYRMRERWAELGGSAGEGSKTKDTRLRAAPQPVGRRHLRPERCLFRMSAR